MKYKYIIMGGGSAMCGLADRLFEELQRKFRPGCEINHFTFDGVKREWFRNVPAHISSKYAEEPDIPA